MRALPIVCGGLLLLAGCAHFEPNPISPAMNATGLETRSLTTEALRTFLETNLDRKIADWPHPLWDLDMLTLAAFYYHPSLDVARAQWHVAQAGVRTAAGRPNPTLTTTPGYSGNPPSGTSPWFPAVDVDIPIETAGKRDKRLSVAEYLSESARLRIDTAAWKIRSNLRTSLLHSAAAHQRVQLLQEGVLAQEQLVHLLEQQAEAGAIARSQLTSSRIVLTNARLDLADAQVQLAEARVHVAEAVGVPVQAMAETRLSFDPLQNSVPLEELTSAAVRRVALQNRTDVLAVLAEYAASESELQLEIAKQYPDIHLGPGYQFDQGENKWALGVSVALPVLNRNQGPIAEAEARREEAAARFNALQARVLAEIEQAVEVFRISDRSSALLQSMADMQASRLTSAEARLQAGSADRVDVLNSQIESFAAELASLDARVKRQEALGDLESAVQRPEDSVTAPLTHPPREERARKAIQS